MKIVCVYREKLENCFASLHSPVFGYVKPKASVYITCAVFVPFWLRKFEALFLHHIAFYFEEKKIHKCVYMRELQERKLPSNFFEFVL